MAHGNPSNAFCPFMSRGDMEGSLEELKRKVMVNFDPLRCFVGDVEASIVESYDLNLINAFPSLSCPKFFSFYSYCRKSIQIH